MRRYVVTVGERAFTIDVHQTAADRFEVTVDGRTFDAQVDAEEDLPGGPIEPGIAPAGPARVRAANAVVLAAPASSSAPPAARGGDVVGAPMPGVILEVQAAPGVTVRRGDALAVLEAMKMRNTIRAPRDGEVAAVLIEPGQAVRAGEPLVRFVSTRG